MVLIVDRDIYCDDLDCFCIVIYTGILGRDLDRDLDRSLGLDHDLR